MIKSQKRVDVPVESKADITTRSRFVIPKGTKGKLTERSASAEFSVSYPKGSVMAVIIYQGDNGKTLLDQHWQTRTKSLYD